MKKIKINCVEMTREIRDRLYLETKDFNNDELIELYSHSSDEADKKNKKKNKLKVAQSVAADLGSAYFSE